MNEEQIKQNAANYVLNFTPTGVITEDRLKCYIAGAKSRSPQELFDELDSYQKADFMKNNTEWARTCDLRDELKLRHEL